MSRRPYKRPCRWVGAFNQFKLTTATAVAGIPTSNQELDLFYKWSNSQFLNVFDLGEQPDLLALWQFMPGGAMT